jgi:sortase A
MHARRARFLRVRTLVSAVCLLVGLVLLTEFGYGMWQGIREQQHLNQVWQYEVAAPHPIQHAVDAGLKHPLNGVDFAISIPKLGYHAAIREGVDSGVLYASPGHYPGTRWPGDPGTVGVAAHNVYWINFPELVRGDEIDLETRYGVYRYRVASTEIVNPDNRTVLVTDSDGYHLTLTTCWPLWAGAFATQRYIIHTDQFWPVTQRPAYT